MNRNYIYVGLTSDLNKRIRRHNRGYKKTTRSYVPFELIYTEQVDTRSEARSREKYWKSGVGKEKLREIKNFK